MEKNNFGGAWTEQKIQVFVKYLIAYLQIMKNKQFELIYFDGFAGCGEIELNSKSEDSLLEGVATQVLNINSPCEFDIYYLVELNEKRAHHLKQTLTSKFPEKFEARKAWIVQDDCNLRLKSFAEYLKQKTYRRGLAFIDPFGMSVDWSSLEVFKDVPVDLWLLLPSGIGVNRLLNNDGRIIEGNKKKLEKFLGIDFQMIEDSFYRKEKNLFDETELTKEAEAIAKIALLYKKRMETVWKYVSDPMPLKNSVGSVMYHFIFASQNATAQKIANQIIK